MERTQVAGSRCSPRNTIGGIGLVIGPLGLLAAKWRRDPMLLDEHRYGMDVAFILMLLVTSVTGLALLILRETSAMGVLLALHLGVVFSLFLTLPYSKFVHGIYRFLALVRYAKERRVRVEVETAPAVKPKIALTGQGGPRP